MLTFFTVSYSGDAARFALLRRSVLAFCSAPFKHYVVVPKRDIPSFRALVDDGGAGETVILAQEEFLSRRYLGSRFAQEIARRFPGQAWRLSRFVGRPGWIRQQIVKLGAPQVLQEEKIVVVDSDVFFTRRFGEDFFKEKPSKKLLLKRFPVEEKGKQRKYIRAAREILALSPGTTEHNFMAWPALFYRDWMLSLQEYLEQLYSEPWQDVLFPVSLLSEYSLYGVYVDEVLKPQAVDYIGRPLHLGVFTKEDLGRAIDDAVQPLSEQGDCIYSDRLRPICMLVQSNLGLSVEQYESKVEPILSASQTA